MRRIIKIGKITGSHIHGADTKATRAGIEQVEVHQARQKILQWRKIIEAQS